MGDELADATQMTINSVVRGVLGVAFVQSLLIGIGLLLAGIPYAGVWTLLILFLTILQLQPAEMVIFLGVIGGFMLSGFTGLFTGAIVMSLGYKLFLIWINGGTQAPQENPD
jgi:predicted PurR-regulated permease PerM